MAWLLRVDILYKTESKIYWTIDQYPRKSLIYKEFSKLASDLQLYG